jgi:hypothetical protein
VILGVCFTALQAYEYTHAAFGISGNLYGATFFMATGFHGAHVIIGTIFLAVCLIRLMMGHFTPEKHFGFEAAAWYWHFVDVVWLFLFAFVYVAFLELAASPPVWLHMLIWLPLATLLTLLILPPFKATLFALQWKHNAHEAQLDLDPVEGASEADKAETARSDTDAA